MKPGTKFMIEIGETKIIERPKKGDISVTSVTINYAESMEVQICPAMYATDHQIMNEIAKHCADLLN